MLSLKKPERSGAGVWSESPDDLLQEPTQMFFSEHSERHWVVRVAAANDVPKDSRDYIGRWGINGPKHSGDYVHTARQIVLRVQESILRAVSSGPNSYDEHELFDEYVAWAAARSPDLDSKSQVWLLTSLKKTSDGMVLRQPWPIGDHGLREVVPDVAQDPADMFVKKGEIDNSDAEEPVRDFWASIGRTGFRRLHKVGGCFTTPERCRNFVFLSALEAQIEKSDVACKRCWPDLQLGEELDSGSDDGVTESSSTEDPGIALMQEQLDAAV